MPVHCAVKLQAEQTRERENPLSAHVQRAQIENDRTLIQFLIRPSLDANMARNTRLTPVASGQTQGDHQGYFLPSDGPCVTACKRRLDVPAGNGERAWRMYG